MWRLSPNLATTARTLSRRNDSVCLCSRTCVSSQKVEPSKSSPASSPPPPPPPPNAKSGGGVFWKLLGLSFVGVGGVVGYAWYDSSFRQRVQDTIPFSRAAFDYLSSYLPPSTGEVVIKVDHTIPPASLPRRVPVAKIETQVATEAVDNAQTIANTESVTKTESAEAAAERAKLIEREKTEEAVKRRELEEAAANAELESKLNLLVAESTKSVTAALSSLALATAVVSDYNRDLRNILKETALDDPSMTSTTLRINNRDAILISEVDAKQAKIALDDLRSAIEEGKTNAVTVHNSLMLTSEEELNKLNYSLNSAVSQLKRAQSESNVLVEYQNLVRKSKEQFYRELESAIPDVKITQRLRDGQLSEEELNMLIAHAHRRVEQLQKQIINHESAEQQRLRAALEQQREENEKLAAEQVKHEQAHLKDDVEVFKQKWEEESRIRHERAMRSLLARQAAAHSEHLADVLRVQKRELQAAFDVYLATRLDEEKAIFQRFVMGWIGRIRGVDKALADRAEIEQKARRAQDLWLACQTLQSVLNYGSSGKNSDLPWEDRLKPLGPELAVITTSAPEDAPVLSAVVSSVPDIAKSRGVWTEQSLVERFARVYSVARRVAFVGEEDNSSLFRYALSYFLSLLVFRQPEGDDIDSEILVDRLTPFALLDRAYASLERGALEQAVRYVNQLTGESRRVAADWLREAILLLETKQAADVLLAYAAAANIKQ